MTGGPASSSSEAAESEEVPPGRRAPDRDDLPAVRADDPPAVPGDHGLAVRPEDPVADVEGSQPPRAGIGWQALSLIRETVQLVVIALVLAFIIKSLALQAFFIPSGSMLQTLQIGDRVLVEKLTYHLREPQRGEIIVFRRPGLADEGFSVAGTWRSFLEGIGLSEPDPDRDLIKRIIALPGETVELRDGVVHVNGLPLEEPYTSPETRDFPPVVVPDGEYYVLGDNRTNSLDSRFTLGTVPEENVVGRAFAIIWPPSEATLDMDADYPGVGETPLPTGG